ncbi:hypothetical protein ABER75_11470 [Niallia taxi]|uniref:hypothetical protein n=1 Tax=Niallia taxi TaxID=2499688 RepID=UPI0020421AA9|nr:hypothetical protein [Niallia taxi]MCM3216713.1 hypothetical protein [Niallia taxi]
MKKNLLMTLLLAISMLLVACGSDEVTEKTSTTKEETTKTEKTTDNSTDEKKVEENTETTDENISWEDKVKKIASSDGSETEKHDEVVTYARDYKATDEELKDFESYIIQEYKNQNYLKDVTNNEYMLENIFKAFVIDYSYEDSQASPMQDFAFDFLQNTKYNYRGAETADSESTLANEDQMNSALEEMGK